MKKERRRCYWLVKPPALAKVVHQETTTTMSTAGSTVTIEHIEQRDESKKTQKMDDKSEHGKELDIEEHEEVDTETHERTTDDEETEDEPSIVEFEDPVYELSQSHEMEPEYESMTAEQEAAEVQALSPVGQAGYRELTKLHQHQADIERKMTRVTKIIEERTKARVPGLPVDLIRRHVWEEPAGRQELHRMTERQKTQFRIKQDEIPHMERPGTDRGYYLFVKDDAGCLIEQQSRQTIQDTDTDQHLPTDLITETEASTYQVPEQDDPTIDDNAETISSIFTADYNCEEVETSLSTISDAFHTIAQEYEKLTDTVPHMSKIQAAQVIARLPVLPILKQEVKKEKVETTNVVEIELVPGTSTEQPAAEAEKTMEEPTGEAIVERTTEEGDDEPNKSTVDEYFRKYMLSGKGKNPDKSTVDEYFRKYMLSGKGKNPEEKIQEACKEINYRNLVVLIAVGDYVMNQARNIKEVAKKWGLSFSAIQRAMSRKREHSVGGRQYAKKKKVKEKQGDPVKRSKQTEKKSTTESAEATSLPPVEPDQDSLDSTELPDMPWART